MINSNVSSFQNGVDSIYNTCKTYGSTPTASTPTAINTSIKAIYTNRYNAGYSAAGGDVKHTLIVSVNLANYAKYPQAVVVIKDNSTGGTVCSFSPFWTTDSSGSNTHSTGRNTSVQSTSFIV